MLLSRLARSLGSTRSLCERASQLERVAAARQVGRRAFVATTSQWQQGQPAPRAAIMVVGNEVLSGKIQDTNSVWLARLLYSRGVDLIRMEVIPDDITVISETAKKLSDLVGPEGFVFSSGGIGPTHDDMTYDGIAKAFGLKLAVHAPTVDKMRVHYEKQGKELNAARMRMATLPEGSVVHWTPDCWVPLAQVKNVYVLPGVPWLFKQMLEANKGLFTGPLMTSATLWTKSGEGDLADALTKVAEKFSSVSIGSYPNTQKDGPKLFTTKLTFDGRDPEAIGAAVAAVREAVPETFDKLPE